MLPESVIEEHAVQRKGFSAHNVFLSLAIIQDMLSLRRLCCHDLLSLAGAEIRKVKIYSK